jgi:sugar lactone lactonase YvrE
MNARCTLLTFVAAIAAAFFNPDSCAAAEETPKPGTLITVAGSGPIGLSPDGTPALKAVFHEPFGLALDAAGNLFISETLNHRVRKVATDGMLTTVAGNGPVGEGNGDFGGDGGPAKEAVLYNPMFVALDGTGNLYFVDRWNHRIRKVSADGIITTVAGTGSEGFSGDGGPATEAKLAAPHGLALDAEGNLIIADTVNHRVRRVDKNGIITTIAGTGRAGYTPEGGQATAARLNSPDGLAVDLQGNLYIADLFNHRVRKVSPDGVITLVAGTGKAGFSGDGGPAKEAELNSPSGVAVDTAGNVFVTDWTNHRIRKISPEGIITTVAGSDKKTFSGEGGPATEAGLRGPSGVIIDGEGNLYFADSTAYVDDEFKDTKEGEGERVVKVFGVAAPGLIAGKPFPQ